MRKPEYLVPIVGGLALVAVVIIAIWLGLTLPPCIRSHVEKHYVPPQPTMIGELIVLMPGYWIDMHVCDERAAKLE